MEYTVSPVSEVSPQTDRRRFDSASAPALVAGLGDRRTILRLIKDSAHFLEMAATPKGVVVTEQYETKCLHRKGALTSDEAVALIKRYEKESVSDVADWYPTLVRWRGLRFGNPRLFALLNETYRISNPLMISAVVGLGVLAYFLCVVLGMALHIQGKIIFLPLVVYALLVAKRIDFADRSRGSYGYGR